MNDDMKQRAAQRLESMLAEVLSRTDPQDASNAGWVLHGAATLACSLGLIDVDDCDRLGETADKHILMVKK